MPMIGCVFGLGELILPRVNNDNLKYDDLSLHAIR